jgi:hypothetical protein
VHHPSSFPLFSVTGSVTPAASEWRLQYLPRLAVATKMERSRGNGPCVRTLKLDACLPNALLKARLKELGFEDVKTLRDEGFSAGMKDHIVWDLDLKPGTPSSTDTFLTFVSSVRILLVQSSVCLMQGGIRLESAMYPGPTSRFVLCSDPNLPPGQGIGELPLDEKVTLIAEFFSFNTSRLGGGRPCNHGTGAINVVQRSKILFLLPD